ncbi:MAG: acyl-CoA dehydrogenase family protein [Burkholderiales bacterium]
MTNEHRARPAPARLDPEPPPRDELIARCGALTPLLSRNAARTDQDRGVAEENMAALGDAGLLRLAVAHRYGGFQTPVRTMIDVTSTLAEACGSTAWVVANRYVATWVASLLEKPAQDEIFGDDPDAGVAGAFAPSTQMRRVSGGVVVSGKWYYCSGSAFATWGLLGLMELDKDGNAIDQYFSFAPTRELTIEDTWFTTGMRGTSSNCMVANEVFIPNNRMLSVSSALKGVYPTPDKSEALYRSTFGAFLPLNLTGPLLGLGRAALRHVIETAPKRGIATTVFKKQTDSSAFQIQVAEAAIKIDSAEFHVSRAARDVDDAAARGDMINLVNRTRIRADAGHAVAQVTEAINMLVRAHGAGSFAESNPMQRIWRDANIASNHGALLSPVCMEIYGRALLGVEKSISHLI